MKHTYKLFLDDIRIPKDAFNYTNKQVYNESWTVVRDYDSFVNQITMFGLPELISFDHDLGLLPFSETEQSGYDCAKWLVNYCLDNNCTMPNFLIHSKNPVGAEAIHKLLENFTKFNHKVM